MSADDDLPVKIDVGLKAELKGEIPTEKVGNAVDAILDALSPFTQGMGLIGDHIRFHREKVIIKIGELTIEKAQAENLNLKPVPPKFMVPFIEKASCEDLESELINAWANLLKEASTNYSAQLLPYLNVLSQLGPNEANYLNTMILRRKESFMAVRMGLTNKPIKNKPLPNTNLLALILTDIGEDFPWELMNPKFLKKRELGEDDVSGFLSNLKKDLIKNVKGHGIYWISFNENGWGRSHSISAEDDAFIAFEILEHLRLVSFSEEVAPIEITNGTITITIVKPTLFGARLALIGLGA